jgi:stage II sporulation protein D
MFIVNKPKRMPIPDKIMRPKGIKPKIIRFATLGFLIILIWGCARVPRLADTGVPPQRVPFVRVLLTDSEQQHVVTSKTGTMVIDCYKGGKRFSYNTSRSVQVKADSRRIDLYDQNGSIIDYDIERMLIWPRGKKPVLAIDGKPYRGYFELSVQSGQIRLVNLVYMEDYLRGVVPLEIGPTPKEQTEAIKAQAVAARTYSMSHLDQYGIGADYDLTSGVRDQVYGGVEVERELVNDAINATRGYVIVYDGKMINAYYHSTCGGATDDIEDVWDKEPAPYLVMVNDNDACHISKYFTWEDTFTREQLESRLERYLSRERGQEIHVGELTDIRIVNRTPGGRVNSIVFESTKGHYTFNKEQVRWVVRQSNNPDAILRSARFTLDIKRNPNGQISLVTFNGSGYGHGVGMCQMGARGMAQSGVLFDDILRFYYHGVQLKKLY